MRYTANDFNWAGGFTVKGASTDPNFMPPPRVDEGPKQGRDPSSPDMIKQAPKVNMDASYSWATTHGLTAYDVANRETMTTRMSKASIEVQAHTEKSLRTLDVNLERAESYPRQAEIVKQAGKTEQAEKLERQAAQARRMVTATAEELRILYLTGPRTESFDAVNPHPDTGKSRTDIVSLKSIVEVTIGKSKEDEQLQRHAKLAGFTGKSLYLHGPCLTQGAQNRAEKIGFETGRSVRDYYDFLIGPKKG